MCKCPCEEEEEIPLNTSCDVVGQGCLAPPALTLYAHEQPPTVIDCYKCGMGVCRACSSRRKYLRYGVQLLCDNCQEEEDGTAYHVVLRNAMRAGFSRVDAHAEARRRCLTPAQAKRKAEADRKVFLASLAERSKKPPRINIAGRKIA